MVVFPLVNLLMLGVKTLSKPIASRLKTQAAKHPKFRGYIVRVAQANHRFTTKLQRRIYGHAINVEIRPLNEEKAVQAASDLIGEGFVFSVAGGAMIFEKTRGYIADAKKEENRRQEMEAMRQRDEELAKEVELLREKLQELEQLARGRGLAGVFSFKQANTEDGKSAKPVF